MQASLDKSDRDAFRKAANDKYDKNPQGLEKEEIIECIKEVYNNTINNNLELTLRNECYEDYSVLKRPLKSPQEEVKVAIKLADYLSGRDQNTAIEEFIGKKMPDDVKKSINQNLTNTPMDPHYSHAAKTAIYSIAIHQTLSNGADKKTPSHNANKGALVKQQLQNYLSSENKTMWEQAAKDGRNVADVSIEQMQNEMTAIVMSAMDCDHNDKIKYSEIENKVKKEVKDVIIDSFNKQGYKVNLKDRFISKFNKIIHKYFEPKSSLYKEIAARNPEVFNNLRESMKNITAVQDVKNIDAQQHSPNKQSTSKDNIPKR
ncbi:MAG: hypothetical protein HRU35_08115 [Rickettsiaceae bacterium]|nr:hypothetical protein [Rickettsiaceae bacterium]